MGEFHSFGLAFPVVSQLFRGCVSVNVKSGSESLFWKDRWLNALAPMNIWPNEFLASSFPHGTMRELSLLLQRPPFMNDPDVERILPRLNLVSWGG